MINCHIYLLRNCRRYLSLGAWEEHWGALERRWDVVRSWEAQLRVHYVSGTPWECDLYVSYVSGKLWEVDLFEFSGLGSFWKVV